MKKDDISRLLEQYLSARKQEKEPYFDADEIEELLDSFEDADDYTYYEEVLNLGLKLHPGNSDLQVRQCHQLIFNEQYDEALALLDTFGNDSDVGMLRIECYCSLGQYFDKAIPFIEAEIENDHAYAEHIFEYIATLLNDLDFLPAADHLITWGLKLYPDNQILKDEYCFTLEAENKIPEAIEVCNELIDKNPFSYDYWFMLGRLYSLSGEYDKAIDAFDFALTCDDSNDELKLLRAFCLYMNENHRKALEAYEELSSDPSIWKQIRLLIAECHIHLDEYEKAYAILHAILQEDNSEAIREPSFFSNYLKCCLQADRRQEAFDILEKAFGYLSEEMVTELGYNLLAHEGNSLFIGDENNMTHLLLKRIDRFFKQTRKGRIEMLSEASAGEDALFSWNEPEEKAIPSEHLVREFFKNKENKN